jgi:hypothetical protein
MGMQLLTILKGRRGFCLGRFISKRFTSEEALGAIPHLRSGSVHLQTLSHACTL